MASRELMPCALPFTIGPACARRTSARRDICSETNKESPHPTCCPLALAGARSGACGRRGDDLDRVVWRRLCDPAQRKWRGATDRSRKWNTCAAMGRFAIGHTKRVPQSQTEWSLSVALVAGGEPHADRDTSKPLTTARAAVDGCTPAPCAVGRGIPSTPQSAEARGVSALPLHAERRNDVLGMWHDN